MSRQAWICDSCEGINRTRYDLWTCPGCGKETCEQCFDRYGHCKKCSAGKGGEELRLAANSTGDFAFDPPESASSGRSTP